MPARVSDLWDFPLLLLLAAQVVACGPGTSTAPDVGSFGGTGGVAGGSGGQRSPENTETLIPDPSAAGAPADDEYQCGVGSCAPDDATSCASSDVEPAAPELGCRLALDDEGKLTSVCREAGSGRLDEPCLSTDDCAAGYACVGGGIAGRCRPYCCQSDGCDGMARAYCSKQPERTTEAETNAEALIVSVCMPADDCDLGEPYPCPEGRSCECGPENACMVVRTASNSEAEPGLGMTACVAPGEGAVGEPCPCSFGHVCSIATGKCLALCSTAAPKGACSTRCQASSQLPLGWGVCIDE